MVNRTGIEVNQDKCVQLLNQERIAEVRGADLIDALASDARSEAAMRSLWRAARSWLAAGAAMPLERYAHLPTTSGALRNAARNLWVRRCADLVAPGKPAFKQARQLEAEFFAFVTRGAWLAWRELPDPPESASDLRRALFYIAKFNNGEFLSQRHLARIIAKE